MDNNLDNYLRKRYGYYLTREQAEDEALITMKKGRQVFTCMEVASIIRNIS